MVEKALVVDDGTSVMKWYVWSGWTAHSRERFFLRPRLGAYFPLYTLDLKEAACFASRKAAAQAATAAVSLGRPSTTTVVSEVELIAEAVQK